MFADLRARLPSIAVLASTSMLLSYLIALLSRFRGPSDFFTDDFFYYVVIAKHIAASGLSSFNGIQLTNGYHPLWLLVITGLLKCFGNGLIFFVAVTVLIWIPLPSQSTLRRSICAVLQRRTREGTRWETVPERLAS